MYYRAASDQIPKKYGSGVVLHFARYAELQRTCGSAMSAELYTLPEIILQGAVDGSRRTGPRKSWKGNINEGTDQPMSSLLRIVNDRDRSSVIAADASVGVPKRRLGVTGIS